jgi:putative RNA 2'-phosphotransferase
MNDTKRISKFLSLILRHKPETIGIKLDNNGWADIDELIYKINFKKDIRINFELLKHVVETNDKQRFIISLDGLKIRANQGHSIDIDLDLKPTVPPNMLFHGTATRLIENIKQAGLLPQSRQYVHLSQTEKTAQIVGSRHGIPVILKIKSCEMNNDNYDFFISENGVWLTKIVPTKYIDFDN